MWPRRPQAGVLLWHTGRWLALSFGSTVFTTLVRSAQERRKLGSAWHLIVTAHKVFVSPEACVSKRILCCCLGLLLPAVGGCTSNSGSATPCSNIAIDRFKELTVVDDSVMTDTRAKNGADGTWSFRYAIENMAPEGTEPGQFVAAWFAEWSTLKDLNGYPLEQQDSTRAQGIQEVIICPWEQRTPSNACNADCSACAVNPPTLDLSQAPFRLLAVVNRMDLRTELGTNPVGEGRLVFGLTSGAGDDLSSQPLSGTVIFEYALPTTISLQTWAQRWHALGGRSFGEDYNSNLQEVTDLFVKRGASPGQPNGSALGQARTNESATFWIWQLRQFQLGSDGQLHSHTVRNTPAEAMNGSDGLLQYIQANADAIKADRYLVPETMLGGSSDEIIYRWTFAGLDESARAAYARGTCNGCHAEGENPSVDRIFHVSPLRTGLAKLSSFVNNPEDPAHDDLSRRSGLAQQALCAP
jgi:hypothetical protein